MNKRGWDEQKYRIQRRQFEQEDMDEDGEMPRRFGGRRGEDRANQGRKNHHPKDAGKIRKDPFAPENLRSFIKKPSHPAGEENKKNFKWDAAENQGQNRKSNVQTYRAGKIYRPQNEEIKKKLDQEMQQYRRKICIKPQKKPQRSSNQAIVVGSDSEQELSFQMIKPDNQHSLQDSQRPEELSYSYFSKLAKKQSPFPLGNNNDKKQVVKYAESIKIQPKKKEQKTVDKQKIGKRQQAQQTTKKPEVEKEKIMKKQPFEQIKTYKIQHKRQPQIQSIKIVKQFKQSAENFIKQKQQPSLVLKNADIQMQPLFPACDPFPKSIPTDFFPNEITHIISDYNFAHSSPPLTNPSNLQNQLTQAEIKQKIQDLSTGIPAAIYLTFQSKQNILQFALKEIDLVQLGATVKLDSTGNCALKRFQDIDKDKLGSYISFQKTSYYFPKMGASYNQHLHYTELADRQQTRDSTNRFELEVCRVKLDSEMAGKPAKVDKSVVVVRLVGVRCMECEARNEVAVIQNDQSVGCSCRNCSAKIEGRIVEVRVKTI